MTFGEYTAREMVAETGAGRLSITPVHGLETPPGAEETGLEKDPVPSRASANTQRGLCSPRRPLVFSEANCKSREGTPAQSQCRSHRTPVGTAGQ